MLAFLTGRVACLESVDHLERGKKDWWCQNLARLAGLGVVIFFLMISGAFRTVEILAVVTYPQKKKRKKGPTVKMSMSVVGYKRECETLTNIPM